MKSVANSPSNETLETPVKLLPVMVTFVPTGPLVGVKAVISGGEIISNVSSLLSEPSEFWTVRLPVVAPSGTLALI